MTLLWRTGMLAFIVAWGVSVAAFAEEPCCGMMKKDHQMGGMQQRGMSGMGTMEMHRHSKMMEGMKDQPQLMQEMKKHMRMMDEMMEQMMMQPQQGMTPPGSESEPQEHHPGKGQ